MQTWSAPFHCIILNFRNKLGQLQVQKWPEFKPVCLSNYEHRYVLLSFVTPRNHQLPVSTVSKPICSSQNLHLLPGSFSMVKLNSHTNGRPHSWGTSTLAASSNPLPSFNQQRVGIHPPTCVYGIVSFPITLTFSLYAVVCTPSLLFYIMQSSFFKTPTMWCPHSRLC